MPDTLGPVEVEFSIPRDFEKDIDSAIKKMAGLTGAASKLPSEVKAAMAEQSAIIKTIESDIKTLESALKTVAPGAAKQEMIQEVAAAKKALTEEKAALQQLSVSYDQSRESSKRLTIQLRDMQDQLAKLRIAGKQNTEEYKILEGAAARLADELRDVRHVTKSIGDDQAQFKGFAEGVTGLTGAFSAAGGAVAIFAGENENLQKIQTRVQGLMAITIGLQQVSTSLNKDSAFMTVTVVKAKQLWAAAETRLTAALWGSNVAAKALMATVTLGASIAIPALIALYDRLVTKQKEAADAQREAGRITTESNIEAGKARIEIDQMIRKLEKFRGSKESEKRLLSEVNKAYSETFGTYKTLADWLDVLKAKAADYVKVMFLQSKATRLVDKAIKYDTQAQQIAAQPMTDFVDDLDVNRNTNIFGQVDEQKLRQIAEERKKQQVKLAESRKELALKEAEIIQSELQSLQNTAGINTGFEDDGKDKAKQTYAQKLAEVKKFFELYKQSIELGQAEAAAIFKRQLPDAGSYEDYINKELEKATAEGNTDKTAALIPEKNAISSSFKNLLNDYQTYSDERAAIEKKFNADILKLTQTGYAEKARVAEQERDKELKALDDSQPLNKMIEKYKTYRQKIADITRESQAEIDALRASGNLGEAKEAELQRDLEIQRLILDNEFSQYEQIEQLGRRELRAFMAKIKTKIDLLRAEGKAVAELEKVYAEAESELNKSGNKNLAAAGSLMSSIAQAAGSANEELGRMVGLAGNLASNLASALDGFKQGSPSSISSFGTIVSIFATISDELDKQWGRQARIAEIEQQRERYNNRLRIIIDETTDALDRQLKALNSINNADKGQAYSNTIDFVQASIESTRAALDNLKFEFLPAPDDLDQTIDLAFLKFATKAETEAQAIRIALADGLIGQEQADIALEYLATLENLGDQAAELSQQRIEFLVQTNSVDLANELADTIVNAFNEGESAAMAWGKVTDQVMSNAIKNALKMKLLSEPISDAVAALADDMQDGALSQSEQDAFRNRINIAAENFNQALNLYPDLFGVDAPVNQSQERNAFSGMTQQTGSELLGQFTALRMSAAAIADILRDERQSRISMRQSLEVIAQNTAYCRKLENIDRVLSVIENDGVKVR